MNKKLIIVLLLFTFLFVGCTKKVDYAIKFKEDYESVNGETNASGKGHRELNINDDNPFVYASAKEIVEKIENGETFYVYFGSKLCPWCRSVIEKAIEVANAKDINTIYYIDIWDNDGNEILRDKYELDGNDLKLVSEGTDDYYKLLELLDNVLSDYSLKDKDGNVVSVNEKRIYAPNFIYIENGKAVKLVSGISSKQTDSRGELTDEILEDQENIFNKFFKS